MTATVATLSNTSVPYAQAFAAARSGLPGGRHGALSSLRERAFERFARHGFPTTRVEAWKFTNLNPLARTDFRLADGAGPVPAMLVARARLNRAGTLGVGAYVAVFVNGRLDKSLSDLGRLPAGARIDSLASLLETAPDELASSLGDSSDDRARALVELNTAFMADGAVLRLGSGVALDRPLHLIFVGTAGDVPAAIHVRNLILAEAGASATVIESYVGADEGTYWTNAVTRIVAGPDAAIRHYKLQAEGAAAFHTAETEAALSRGAAYTSFVMSSGGLLARNEIDVRFEGEGVSCRLDGVTLARGRQHIDNTTRIDHAKPRGSSAQVYKNIVDGHGHTVFQGRIRVAPDAQKTDAQQLNRALLLSDHAAADAKPELEILADDVKCSHGATVGDLDKDSLFYLRARGLDQDAARALLIAAFADETIDMIGTEAERAYFHGALSRWLKAAQGVG